MPNPYMGGGWPSLPNPYATGGVYVEVRTSSRHVRIERVISPGHTMTVCFAPCRQILPRNSVYVIGGNGVRETSQFVLPDDRDRVTLDVKTGSTGQAAGGALLLGAGLLAAVIGGALLLRGDSSSTGRSMSRSLTAGGFFLIGGGIVSGLLGVYLLSDAQTTVSSSTGTHFSGTPVPRQKHGRVALTWRGLEF